MTSAPSIPPFVGLGGYFQSGKDAVADYLVERHGFVKLNMSKPIDEFLAAVNPRIDATVHVRMPQWWKRLWATPAAEIEFRRYREYRDDVGYTEAKKHDEVRPLLQRLGYDAARQIIGDSVWVDIIGRTANEWREHGRGVVISGIRFPNETSLIREHSGFAVWIERPGIARRATIAHITEQALSSADFDHVIQNDGSLADLYRKADALLNLGTEK